jgi:hypothetical protein
VLQQPRGWVAAELVWKISPGCFAEKEHPLQQIICFQHPRSLVHFEPGGLKADKGESDY